MKVLGIVVEYNPFHNGHAYHLKKSIELTGADYVIAVMSGNFIQRGEPAIINKWARCRQALLCGVDLVIELPVVYAMASAEYFAFGAIKLLDSLGVTDFICFGSENGRIDDLEQIADILVKEPEEYKMLLKENISKGISYPSARDESLRAFLKKSGLQRNIPMEILKTSNNILGIEYLKALKQLKSSIKPYTILRINNSYNSEKLSGEISSATSIRHSVKEYLNEAGKLLNTAEPGKLFHTAFQDSSGHVSFSFQDAMPEASAKIMLQEFIHGRGPVLPNNFLQVLLAYLRMIPSDKLKQHVYIGEGLENRIKEASGQSRTIEELINNICTKRYAKTRINRILFNTLIGVTSGDVKAFNENGGPQYIRILGFNKKGRELLSVIDKKASLPIITKFADYTKYKNNPLLNRMIEIETIATDIYVLGYPGKEYRTGGQDYTQGIVIV